MSYSEYFVKPDWYKPATVVRDGTVYGGMFKLDTIPEEIDLLDTIPEEIDEDHVRKLLDDGFNNDTEPSVEDKYFRTTGTPQRQGEKHANLVPHVHRNSKRPQTVTASYMGPGTHHLARVREGIQPVDPVDMASQAHDLRYACAMGPDDVRKADEKMLRTLKYLADNNLAHPRNLRYGNFIKAKMKGENLGMISKTKFIDGDIDTRFQEYPQDDKNDLYRKLEDLQTKGYGKRRKQGKWVSHVKAFQKKHGCTYKEALQKARSSYRNKSG